MKQNKIMKIITSDKTLKIVKTLIIMFISISIILISYSAGIRRGIWGGIYIAQAVENKSMCDFYNLTRDVEGYCIVNNEVTEDNFKIECNYEKYKIVGSKNLTTKKKFLMIPKRFRAYIIEGCVFE